MKINILKKWRSAKEKRSAQKIKEEQGWLDACVKDVETATNKMHHKPCPINGKVCSSRCVHFRKGDVTYTYNGFERSPVVIQPKCKLWK